MSRRTSRSTSYTSGVNPVGPFRAKVVSVSGGLASIRIPRLGMNNVYDEVPYSGFVPTVGTSVWAFFIEGDASRPMIIVSAEDSQSDINEIVAGTNLNGGGTGGSITVNLDDSITLSSVTADSFYGDLYGDIYGAIHIPVKNVSGGTLSKGTPVYATGAVGASGAVEVEASLAGTGSTMPAMGLLDQDLSNNGQGDVVVSGVLQNIDTDTPGYSVGDELYVSAAGGLTTTRPAGSSELVQKIGKVIRVQQNTGEILVQGAGRTNDVPNSFSTSGDVTVGGDATVTGDLTVNGTTVTLNTETLTVEDNIIVLNSNVTGTPSLDAGIEVERGSISNVSFLWDESEGAWSIGAVDFVVDTDTLFVDASTDRVGIGNTSPSYTLDVSGDGRFTSNLSVGGNTTSTGHFTAQSGGADGGLALRSWTSNGDYQSLATVNMTGSEYILLSDGTHTFIGAGTGGTTHIRGPANDSSPQLTVNSSVITSSGDHTVTGTLIVNGNVGINTASPTQTLDVNGVLNVSGDVRYNNNAIIASYASATNIDHLWHDDGANAWNFCSDTTYKAAGNSALNAATLNVTTANATTINLNTSVHLTNVDADGSMRVQGNNGYIDIGPKNSTYCHIYTDRGSFYFNKTTLYANSTSNKIWHAGNDGSGSGLDADLLDGNHASSFISTATTQTSNVFIRNASPTVYHRDTNNRSAMTHVNSNNYFVLRGSGNDSTTWATYNGYWPAYWNLENNDVVLGGQVYVPVMVGTGSFNTVRYGTGGLLHQFTSLAEQKTGITEINPLLDYLGEKSLLYDLRPIIFQEAEDRVDSSGEPLKTSRGEYAPGFIAEEVHEVAPELTYFDDAGDLISYGPEALIPHLVAELQRLAPMIESLYQAAHPEYVPPTPRDSSRGDAEKAVFDTAAAYTKANPKVTPMPANVSVEDDDEETE